MTKTILSTVILSTILLTSTIFASIPSASASTNLVFNGSFEDPAEDCDGPFDTLGFGSTEIAGWQVSGRGVDWICSYWGASDGNYSVDLNAFAPGVVFQPTSLDIGTTYDLSFDMSGNPDCGSNIKNMIVFANNADVADLYSFDTAIPGHSRSDMIYETHTLSFTAIVEDSQLLFASRTSSACGPVIDNVILTERSSVTEVIIDIKPGSDVNPVNTKSKGVIPVAVYSTADFDATTIDPSTVAFGPNGAAESHGKAHIEDVNGDGLDDVVLHFKTQDSGITKGDTEASLTGATFDGTAIEGSDTIKTK